MKLNFIKKPKQGILTLFTLMLLISLAPFASSTWVNIERQQVEQVSVQTTQLTSETTELLATIQDMETGQRGYIITGLVPYLDTYRNSVQQLSDLLPALRTQLNTNPDTRAEMAELDTLIQQKTNELQDTILVRKDQGFTAAQKIVLQGDGKAYMDQIRGIVKQLLDRQATKTLAISKELNRRALLSLGVGIATFLACATILIVLVVCLFRLVDLQKRFHNERSELIAKISKIAYFDTLTGLANRAKFNDESQIMYNRAVKDNVPMSLFLIDIDNFKTINDTYGHGAGDQVLQAIGERLDSFVRAYCQFCKDVGRYEYQCACMAARLGGDEFVVVFEHMTAAEADSAVRTLMEQMREFVQLETAKVNLSASIGISVFPEGGNTISDLLTSADLAMYAAKEKGKDQFCFHDSFMDSKIQRRIEAELAVRDMINGNNITVYYQPIIDTDTGEVVGTEALLRGRKSTDKFFNPVELISAAEDTNLIIPLGMLILKNACKFMRHCLDVVGEDCDLFVSVNVSVYQLTDPTFASVVEQTLHYCDLTPDHLVLEITETMLMQNFDDSERTLNKLRNLGVRISIDDFGKGYSSFSYLQKLPIDKIKIDISFIQNLGIDIKANEIVKGIILMAHALGMHTCAEGVETEMQWLKLREFGCEQVQGYFKHRALSEQDFVDVLTTPIV